MAQLSLSIGFLGSTIRPSKQLLRAERVEFFASGVKVLFLSGIIFVE